MDSMSAFAQPLISNKNTVLNSENCFKANVTMKNESKTKPNVNLLNLLHSCQNSSVNGNVFKPIGNRIVVPLKFPRKMNTDVSSSQKCDKLTKDPVLLQSFVTSTKTTKPIKMEYPFQKKKVIDMTWNSLSKEEADYSVLTPIEIKKEIEQEASDISQMTPTRSSNQKNGFTYFYCDNHKIKEEIKSFTSEFPGYFSNSSQSDVYAELTCLSWLRNSKSKQILEILKKCNPDKPFSSFPEWLTDKECSNIESKMQSIFTAYSKIQSFQRLPEPISCKFDPKNKPPFSFSCLIFMAIEDSETKQLKVKDIYEWFCKHYPYFRSSCTSWKNSIRHNLSLNRCFSKAKTAKSEEGSPKSTFWCVHPAYRPNLIEALKKANALYCNYHGEEIVQPAVLKDLTNSSSRTYAERAPYCRSPAQRKSSIQNNVFLNLLARNNGDPDITSAALNLIDLRENGTNIKSEEQADLIHHTIEEIFRDSYFRYQCGLSDFRDDLVEDDSQVREMLVIRNSSEDHQYCLKNSSHLALKNVERRSSSISVKSEPDAAYEFETASSVEEEQDMAVQDIMEDVLVGCEDDDKKEISLFDSGFGSIRSIEREVRQSETKKKRREKKKLVSNQKPVLHSSGSRRNRSRKTKVKKFFETLEPAIFKTEKTAKNLSKKMRESRKRNINTCYRSSVSKSRDLVSKHSRPVRNSKYYTRSKRDRLLCQELKAKRRVKRARKNSFKKSLDASDDDEVKRAAGSLLRLAGLIKSHA